METKLKTNLKNYNIMKDLKIYDQRKELNEFEIEGIISLISDNFNTLFFQCYVNKTLHFEINEVTIGFYLINNNLFLTVFNDLKENDTFRVDLSKEVLYKVDKEMETIKTVDFDYLETL